MKINEKLENQQLYLTMCDKDTANLCQTLKVYGKTKRNCKIVYGFLVYLSQKETDFSVMQKTGRECDIYQFVTKNCDKLIPVTVRTIEKWTGINRNSVTISLQHLINLGVITKTRQSICDTNTNTNSNTNVNSNSSTLDISTLEDEKVEVETDNNFKQDLNMEEKLNETKWDEKKFQEMNERKKVIMASIEKFIAASPTLSDDKVKEYIELYSTKLREVYYRQDYANNAIAMMVSRIAKFKAKGTAPMTTKNGVEMKTPPKWILDNFEKLVKVGQNVYSGVGNGMQYLNQKLADDLMKDEYRDNIEGYKNWYVNYILTNYAPSILEECTKPNTTIEQIKAVLVNLWNKVCTNFQVDLDNF